MSSPVISARGVSKVYRLGELGRSNTLRETVSGWFRSKGNTAGGEGARSASTERFWALKDVSFDVAKGEVLGVIGANGAGKSTLLKILSRITEPSSGEIELSGRVASLLEVGTGFNDELTGQENIVLNGAILGMSKREIDRKFDEIVEFSGVRPFLDTPVKRYSSGMKMRLAFAVAAHLEPEILIIDEVLAVGDVEFQRKCLGKMNDVARSGRTVLFVSHNMAAVENLCLRTLVLRAGEVALDGPTQDGIRYYRELAGAVDQPGPASRWLHSARFEGQDGHASSLSMLSAASLKIRFSTPRPTTRPKVGVVLKRNTTGEPVFGVNTEMLGLPHLGEPSTTFTCVFEFGRLDLIYGDYVADIWLAADGETYDVVYSAAFLEIMEADVYGSGKLPSPSFGPLVVFPKSTIRSAPAPAEKTAAMLDEQQSSNAER